MKKKRFCFRVLMLGLLILTCSLATNAAENTAITEVNRDCDRFQSQAKRMSEGNVDLLMVGDSITHFWETNGKNVWNKYYANRNAMNFGISGDKTQQVLWRLANAPTDKISPKMAVVMIGTNNIGHKDGNTPSQTVEGVQKIVDVLKGKYPKMKILLLEVFPRSPKATDNLRIKVDEINKGLRKIYQDKKVENVQLYSINELFLDKDGNLPNTIMPDFLHPNEAGYEIWAKAIEPMVSEVLDKEPAECIGVDRSFDWWQNRYKEKYDILKKGHFDILMVGDSITHFWETSGKEKWNKFYGDRAVNLGIGGDQTQHVIWRLEHYDFAKNNPRLAVLLIGVNNMSAGSTASNTDRGIRKICQILHVKFPKMKIIVLNVFPWGNKEETAKHDKIKDVNANLSFYVRDLDYVTLTNINNVFLDKDGNLPASVMPDYLHPNAEGYQRWGAALEKAISTMAP